MFQAATNLVRKFTLPVITSIRSVAGTTASGTGTFIIINDEGWILTAAHIFKSMREISEGQQRTRALQAQIGAAKAKTMGRKGRKDGIRGPKPTDIEDWSVWWGKDGAQLDPSSITLIEPADLAIARFAQPIEGIEKYPVFKDPTKDFEPGQGLCRMGFPFYKLVTTYDATINRFHVHNLPLPLFLNEGILSRMSEVILVDQFGNLLPPPPFPLMTIETSSPGIRGQSGGPIFDDKGTVWGIQSATTSYELDYNVKEKQYYHVGVGVHASTIIGLLKQKNVKHAVSDY